MSLQAPALCETGRGNGPRLVLASGSPRRLDLLRGIGIEPHRVLSCDVDETPLPREKPRDLARRLARAKAEAGLALTTPEERGSSFLLAADTVVGVGTRILPKAETEADARTCLALLSGRSHRVTTGLCIVTPRGAFRERLVETRVTFKRLSDVETEAYLRSGEWRGKAGGYAVQGLAAIFVRQMVGSHSSVVGLPLAETASVLGGEGFPLFARFADAAPAS